LSRKLDYLQGKVAQAKLNVKNTFSQPVQLLSRIKHGENLCKQLTIWNICAILDRGRTETDA